MQDGDTRIQNNIRKSLLNGDNQRVDKYKKYKYILRKCLLEAEQNYYHKIFDDTKNSAYHLWKNLGPIINPKKVKRKITINKLLSNGQYVSDNDEISNVMNNYFCEIGKTLQYMIPAAKRNFFSYLPDRSQNTFFLYDLISPPTTVSPFSWAPYILIFSFCSSAPQHIPKIS